MYQIIHTDSGRIVRHILFWLTWILSFTVIQSIGYGKTEWFVWLMYYVITLPVFMAHTYIIAYGLLPLAKKEDRYVTCILGILFLLPVFSIIELFVSNELVFRIFDPERFHEKSNMDLKNVLISGIGNHYIILVFFAIKAGRSWYTSKNRRDELLLWKMETELEIYRYRLQPGLVLSLLNDLDQINYSDPGKSPEMIVKISTFLNRFLFEWKEELIPLQLDIQITNDFLEIHKLAAGERFRSNLVASGNLKPFVIPPFLLLPFLNDAVKLIYGCNESFESNVLIRGEKGYLLYSFTFWSETAFPLKQVPEVEMIRKRLNFAYPGKYRLIVSTDENFIELSLEIFTRKRNEFQISLPMELKNRNRS